MKLSISFLLCPLTKNKRKQVRNKFDKENPKLLLKKSRPPTKNIRTLLIGKLRNPPAFTSPSPVSRQETMITKCVSQIDSYPFSVEVTMGVPCEVRMRKIIPNADISILSLDEGDFDSFDTNVDETSFLKEEDSEGDVQTFFTRVEI